MVAVSTIAYANSSLPFGLKPRSSGIDLTEQKYRINKLLLRQRFAANSAPPGATRSQAELKYLDAQIGIERRAFDEVAAACGGDDVCRDNSRQHLMNVIALRHRYQALQAKTGHAPVANYVNQPFLAGMKLPDGREISRPARTEPGPSPIMADDQDDSFDDEVSGRLPNGRPDFEVTERAPRGRVPAKLLDKEPKSIEMDLIR